MAGKAGERTTEFWLVVVVIVASTIALITGDLSQDSWEKVVGAGLIGYPIGRGLAKR